LIYGASDRAVATARSECHGDERCDEEVRGARMSEHM